MLSTNSTQGTCGWQSLNTPTFLLHGDEDLVAINDSEFAVRDAHQFQSLQKFNIVHNAWTSIPISMPENVRSWIPIALNKKETLLCYCAAAGRIHRTLVTCNLRTRSTRIYDSSVPMLTNSKRTLLIGDKLHVVSYRTHYIFDKQQGFNRNHRLFHLLPDGFKYCASIIYSESRRSIIAMDGAPEDPNNRFAAYSMVTQQWERLQWPECPNMVWSAPLCSADGKYLITFGGYESTCKTDEIVVFDLNDQTSKPKRSTVLCPEKGNFRAVTMIDKNAGELATFGFVRDCYGKAEMNGVQLPPLYIIQLMAKWVEMEYVYLLRMAKSGHWKIRMDHILKSIT